MTVNQDRAIEIGRLLAIYPDGLTIHELSLELGCSQQLARLAVHECRELLAAHPYNVVSEPPAGWGPWKYKLVATRAEARWWEENRLTDAETRLRTMDAVMTSIVNATDGRSVEGRKARMIHKALYRLVEDIHDVDVNGKV